MNTTKKPLDDVNCRLALTYAFDYAAGIKMVAITDKVSQGSPATGALPVGMLGSLPASDAYKRDLDAAKEYLADCKYKPEDFTLELSWVGEVPLEERFALLMQANFAEIGIKSKVKKIPWALFSEQVTKPENTPNISQVFVNAVTGDPDTLIYGMYSFLGRRHLAVAGIPEGRQGRRIPRQGPHRRRPDEERADAYTKLGKRLRELAPTIFAYDQTAVFAASKRVSVPALTDPAKAFGLAGMGFTFRLMEMTRVSRRDAGRPAASPPARSPAPRGLRPMPPVVRLLAKRLGTSLIVLVGVSMLIFAIARVIPGDPARIALGPLATAEQVTALRARLHLDQPIVAQYGYFLARPLPRRSRRLALHQPAGDHRHRPVPAGHARAGLRCPAS